MRGVHNRTDTYRQIWEDGVAPRSAPRVNIHMLLIIICAFITLTAVVVITKMRGPGGMNNSGLGYMSEQWLAEHRQSRDR